MIFRSATRLVHIHVEAFRDFDEEQAEKVISNTFNEEAFIANSGVTFNINPIEKWIEALEEIKRLNVELLKSKDEHIKLLEKLIQNKESWSF